MCSVFWKQCFFLISIISLTSKSKQKFCRESKGILLVASYLHVLPVLEASKGIKIDSFAGVCICEWTAFQEPNGCLSQMYWNLLQILASNYIRHKGTSMTQSSTLAKVVVSRKKTTGKEGQKVRKEKRKRKCYARS